MSAPAHFEDASVDDHAAVAPASAYTLAADGNDEETLMPSEPNTFKETRDEHGNIHRFVVVQKIPGQVEWLGGGSSSMVGLLDDGTVLKYPWIKGEEERQFRAEAAMYEALGEHPRIIKCYGLTEYGLKLERGWPLLNSLDTADPRTKLHWAIQTAEAAAYIHSKAVLHCDLHPNNLLLDADNNIKLCDFQGIMEGCEGEAYEATRYCLPRPEPVPSILSELFALGSVIYRFMNGCHPYANLPGDEVERKYARSEFPATDFLAGPQVLKCWRQEYSCADELVSELMQLQC